MAQKIWIYVISKELDAPQMQQLKMNCEKFVGSWTAHDLKLTAGFEIFRNRLLIIKVEGSGYNASGCSVDKLQYFIKQQESDLNIELLNRLLVTMEVDGLLLIEHSSKIKELLSSGIINENTLVYDTAISSSEEFKDWKKPLKNTWLSKYLEGISH